MSLDDQSMELPDLSFKKLKPSNSARKYDIESRSNRSNRSSKRSMNKSNRSNQTRSSRSGKRVVIVEDGDLVALKEENYEEELGADIYLSTTVILCKYFNTWNRYKKGSQDDPAPDIWLRDLILMLVLCFFTLSVQCYITFILWNTYGINQIYKPKYE